MNHNRFFVKTEKHLYNKPHDDIDLYCRGVYFYNTDKIVIDTIGLLAQHLLYYWSVSERLIDN